MLFIGMVTEVLVFLISAFDTPVRDYPWEQVFPVLASQNPEDSPHSTPVRNNESGAAARTFSPQVANESGLGFPHDLTGQTENYNRQMEQLNSTLSGLNALYELQLKSISGQIDTIEQINRGLQRLKSSYSDSLPDGTLIGRETERMASQLRELNDAYARMLQAMTVSRGGNGNNPQS
jgi:hypothetical protein